MSIDNKIIKKAIFVNGLLLTYFICPNLSSFLGIVFLVSLLTITQPYGFLGTKIEIFSNQPNKYLNIDYIHKRYNNFITSSLIKQIISLFSIYLFTKICWYIPTWLVLVIVGQIYVAWDLLQETGIVKMVKQNINLMKNSVQKFMNLIPKYHSQ